MDRTRNATWARRPLSLEQLELRLPLTASLGDYTLDTLPETLWFDTSQTSFMSGVTQLNDVLDYVPNDVEVDNIDLRVSGPCSEFCNDMTHGFFFGVSSGSTEVVHISSNAMNQYVVELQNVASFEKVSVFAVSRGSTKLSGDQNRETEYIESATYFVGNHNPDIGLMDDPDIQSDTFDMDDVGATKVVGSPTLHVNGLSVQGAGDAIPGNNPNLDPRAATVSLVTDPATDLVVVIENSGGNVASTNFRLGRLELGTEDQSSFNLLGAHSRQGIAIGDPVGGVTPAFASDGERIHEYSIDANGDWSFVASSAPAVSLFAGQSYEYFSENDTNVPQPFNRVPDPALGAYHHIGAIDHHDGSLWVGLFGRRYCVDGWTCASGMLRLGYYETAVAKLNADDFSVEAFYVFRGDAISAPDLNDYQRSAIQNIDATAFDGDDLWFSSFEHGYGFGLFRLEVSTLPAGGGTFNVQAVNNGIVRKMDVNVRRLGGDFVGGSHNVSDFFAQGLRYVKTAADQPGRLFAQYSNLNGGFLPTPMSGIYEFVLPCNGAAPQINTPNRIWHFPHDTGTGVAFTHPEGFEFVPGLENQIFLADSQGIEIDQMRLNQFYGLPGDYNNDGTVDAADYTVWRDNLGSTQFLPNDITPDVVDQSDYDVWFANFGATQSRCKPTVKKQQIMFLVNNEHEVDSMDDRLPLEFKRQEIAATMKVLPALVVNSHQSQFWRELEPPPTRHQVESKDVVFRTSGSDWDIGLSLD